jgi:cysteine synthase A
MRHLPHIYGSFAETIGQTPLVRLGNLGANLAATVLVKLEFFNPLATVKDRPCLYMLDAAEAAGHLRPGMRVIEASRGSTAYSLASLCAARGYRCTIVAPDTLNDQQKAWFLLLGVELVLTPPALGILGSVAKARELAARDPHSYLTGQFNNTCNVKSHYETTAPEIWEATRGNVDMFVAGIGSGGTFTGVGRYLKEKNPGVTLIAVEPEGAAVLAGEAPGPHGLPGIGPGFVAPVMDTHLPSRLVKVSADDAYAAVRTVLKHEGIPIGLSSGATVHVALQEAAKPENAGKTIVAMVTSGTERYLSTAFAAPELAAAKALTVQPVDPAFLTEAADWALPAPAKAVASF